MTIRRLTAAIRSVLTHRARTAFVRNLNRNIQAADDRGPNWVTAVEDNVLRQDMEWVEQALSRQRSAPAAWIGRPR